ncbi:methylmalonyl Co-A mutase-associated GTPase MeaB [Candidatus Chloroploca sp. M-50]|uniref:Methylmalonyl Co-A mutase-associated GTPase MeaB n=1 Tax=Candidatus Chloroploca mongolica TaxID=2528176 RepID=A0ABS4DEN9_9CHLR|nr:methylmalonyl Co-A mutase-associated GTPase MeaB [Candidatus Chloroploca mongolica]MBP1467903.1 methylmalonyl Co-A mutase-associated GTPase MeaB [Candidatus Chloroploca mongolica]
MTDRRHPTEWTPATGAEGFATHVMDGVTGGHDGLAGSSTRPSLPPSKRRPLLSVEESIQGVLAGNRTVLARTITLVESNAPAHIAKAQQVIQAILPHTGKSIRVGITGVPGVGKSTFIEALGTLLCQRGHNVAVLAVDPSSTLTRGSILGDKTRMEVLSQQPNAFIRPSPTSGSLGGVARKSRESMLLCEAAGFDVILVETVGVGQSEIAVRSMVDFFLLLMLSGAGDELQGIKKGIIELADALVITKVDGDNRAQAKGAQAEYNRALHYLTPATEGWKPRTYTCSSLNGEGIPEVWTMIERFRETTTASDVFAARRRDQALAWVYTMVEDQLKANFFAHPAVKAQLPQIERDVVEGKLPVTVAAQALLQAFDHQP